jgi:hypothetical protein
MMFEVPERSGILSSLAAGWGRRLDLYWDGKAIPTDLIGVAQLRFFDNSSH